MATRRGFEPLLSALTGRRVKPNYTTGPFWDKNQFLTRVFSKSMMLLCKR